MFYSQFILARKGPLGTIWIAAHLERKLRKNQVADTDIGESVDSILFPDVPIALRLSSHLLLGVVRIYSRKVNYLFNDCSETLLRVKQAFRSTAVDLLPEESTAPYHSITLPETFDLDDFELPDSALLNGNFVDHHISTREQITLQDTADATTGYSISQFGLDERFGDGDASQIGLDLDEDIVLDKGSSVPDNLLGSEVMEHDISLQHEENFQSMDIDGCQNDYEEEQHTEITEKLGEDSTVLLEKEQTESQLSCPSQQNLPETSENAQTPSTPALVQEAIPANFQNMALSPSGKASSSNEIEPIVMNPLRPQMESECNDSNQNNDLIKGKQESSHLDVDTLKYHSPSLRPCTSEVPIEDTVPGASESLDREEQTQDINKSSRIEINCSASSEYPEPERMLLATGGDEGTTKDLEQSAIAEKCITESDGSVDRGVSTRGRKRQLTESSPQLTGSLTKKSRAGRNSDYIPDDDDVLASILVGRSSLKLKSTPSLPAAIPSKRQRLTPKTTVAKRKVLLDETMVLHPDTIREQLVSTEDIRRTRRKAPCTRAEIWVIQKCLMEEEIFCEPVFTGMPVDLAVLYGQAFDLNDAPDQEFNADYSILELPEIQNSDLNEKSTVNEIESNREIPAFDEAGKEEIPDAVETSQLVAHETSSSDKGECEVHVDQIFEEGQRFDGDMNTDAGATTLDDVPGALAESMLDQNVERDREDEGDVIPMSEILPVKAQEAEVEENPSTVGENSVFHDIMNLERSQIFDSAAPRDSNDFCSAVGGNDAGFLVVDDADFDDVENEEPDTEEAQSTENSGWSSRTKGVARFLRSIFGDENGGEKTDVAVDQLLAGKTRKEASRMFFETLVLSTKDFILVEQESSFKNISIRPRSKLLKSEF